MTIRKGSAWGSVQPEPPHLISCANERELGKSLELGSAGDLYRLESGSLLTAMGVTFQENPPTRIRVTIDAVAVSYTDLSGSSRRIIAIGSAVIRGSGILGQILVVSNTGFGHGLELLAKAHPNDGKLDVMMISDTMGVRQRLNALRRQRTNSHLPHPDIATSQQTALRWERPGNRRNVRRYRLFVDGFDCGRIQGASFEVLPDAATVYV
jgi:hypothetical protein